MSEVKIGQVWADNDSRHSGHSGRRLDVKLIHEGRAKYWSHYANAALGRWVWIKLNRFKPNSTGYRLVKDVAE